MGGVPIKNIKNIIPGQNKKKTFPNTYKGRKDKYEYLHQTCDVALIAQKAQNKINEINNSKENEIDYLVRKSYNEFKKDVEKLNLTQYDYEEVMFDECTKRLLKDFMIIENYNLFKELPKLFKLYLKTPEKISIAKEILKLYEKVFPQNLKAVIYDLTSDKLKDLQPTVFDGINRNLKYNKEFTPEILTIILSPTTLQKEYYLYEFAVMIFNIKTIEIITIIINAIDEKGNELEDFTFDISNHKMFNVLLQSVKNNRNIKGLFIQFNKENSSLVLSPESCEAIIKKIQSETLSAFYLGNFVLAESLLERFLFTLNNSKALFFFGYDLRNKNYKIIRKKFLPMMKGNKGIQAFAVTGLNGEEKDNVAYIEKDVLEGNNKIKLFYVGEQTLVQYPLVKKQPSSDSKESKKESLED